MEASDSAVSRDISTWLLHDRLADEGLHALLCLDSKLAPGGACSWQGAKVKAVHKAGCETSR